MPDRVQTKRMPKITRAAVRSFAIQSPLCFFKKSSSAFIIKASSMRIQPLSFYSITFYNGNSVPFTRFSMKRQQIFRLAVRDILDSVRHVDLAAFLAWEDIRQRYVRTML